MSTSPRRAPAAPLSPPLPAPDLPQPFPYDSVTAPDSRLAETGFAATSPNVSNANAAGAVAREAQIRAQARQEGFAEARKTAEEQLTRERSNVAAALTQFQHDRTSYFHKVEAEVVQLALSIARKILHREAQLDPLLLAGIVRVALGQIEEATKIVLRVHPQKAHAWRTYFAAQPESRRAPEILDDAALPPDRCVLETSMGRTEIGLEVQLKEIEQGLMDLLAARPGVSAGAGA
jgi:flagellar biosynthesis/type III secretory pathway protein FliH